MITLQLKDNEVHALFGALDMYKSMLGDMNLAFQKKEMPDLYAEEHDVILDLLQERVEVVNDILNKLEGEVNVNREKADTNL